MYSRLVVVVLSGVALTVSCTSFGTEPSGGGPEDASAQLPDVDGRAPLDATNPDGSARSWPDAGPPRDLGPSCDTKDLTNAIATDPTVPSLGGVALTAKSPPGGEASVGECPGATGRCFSTRISTATSTLAGFEANVPLGGASTRRMRLCFHVLVDFAYDALENQKEWMTLAAMSHQADPMTSVQLWPKTTDGSWAFIGTATRAIQNTSTWSKPAENRTARWHKVRLDALFGGDGGVTLTVDEQPAPTGGVVGLWEATSGLFYFGLRPGTARFAASAWFQDVRFAWQ